MNWTGFILALLGAAMCFGRAIWLRLKPANHGDCCYKTRGWWKRNPKTK